MSLALVKKWKSSKVTDVMGAERFFLPFGDYCLRLVGHGNKVFGWCVCYVAEMEYFIFGMFYKSGKSKKSTPTLLSTRISAVMVM